MNYIGSTRSNYFAVKDLEAYKAFLAQFGDVELIESEADQGLVGFVMGKYSDSGCLPNTKGPDNDECDFIAELAHHLADGEVAIVIEIGYEGARYLGGSATAVNNQGELVTINTDSIYDLAKGLGTKITRAEG